MQIQKMRSAFSMITAIFVIVLMATVAMFVMNLSGKIIKSTTAQYQNEQAELYAKSYTEYAILAVTGHNRTTNCVQTITNSPTSMNGYRIRTQIAYIGPTSEIGSCAGTRQLSTNVTTPQTPLSIMIDVYVDYKEVDDLTGPWLTVHRRTIQKI